MNLSLESAKKQRTVDYFKRLADNLKKLRTAKGMTQAELAAALGVKRSSYTAFETARNEPNISVVVAAANFFNVSLDYLVGRNRVMT